MKLHVLVPAQMHLTVTMYGNVNNEYLVNCNMDWIWWLPAMQKWTECLLSKWGNIDVHHNTLRCSFDQLLLKNVQEKPLGLKNADKCFLDARLPQTVSNNNNKPWPSG